MEPRGSPRGLSPGLLSHEGRAAVEREPALRAKREAPGMIAHVMKLEADRQVLPVPLGQPSLPRHRLPGDLARGFIALQAVVGDLTRLRPIDRFKVVALM